MKKESRSVEVVVIGAGLFGSIIAKALRASGHQVVVLDDRRPLSGSRPAACLMKPSWFSGLGRAVYDLGLRTLSELYSVDTLTFRTSLLKKVDVDVFWIDPATILTGDVDQTTALRLQRVAGTLLWAVHCTGPVDYLARTVVVAAGVWTGKLLPSIRQQSIAGVAFLWKDQRLPQPFIRPWAPYKQIVAFNRGRDAWASDGSAILEANFTPERIATARRRVLDVLPEAWKADASPPEEIVGLRPYGKAKPCLLEDVARGLWVASGGAKNGTLAAGWAAAKLVEALQ